MSLVGFVAAEGRERLLGLDPNLALCHQGVSGRGQAVVPAQTWCLVLWSPRS